MSSPESVESWRQRLVAMGLPVREAGSHCLVSRLRLREDPFPTPSGELRLHELVFSTVGADGFKCLRPRALFQLPILGVGGCTDASALEERVRQAWQQHQSELARTGDWLRRLGVDFRELEQGSVLGFPLESASGEVLVTCTRPCVLVLPARGPLSGSTLERAEDRSLAVDPGIDSASELAMVLTSRLEEIARLHQRLERSPQAPGEEEPAGRARPRSLQHRVIVVGPVLASNRSLLDALRARGYETLLARSDTDALRYFARASPELILADARLGRSEGIDLIPAVRRLVGIEEIPVVLVDASRNEGRRDAARRAGAAGYVTHPIHFEQIQRHLDEIVRRPRRRRFTRYAQRLSASVTATRERVLVSEIGRGGMFLGTEADLPAGSVHGCWITLPQLGRRLQLDAEVVYRRGGDAPGVGVRFRDFQPEGEPTLIDYLAQIDPAAHAPRQA